MERTFFIVAAVSAFISVAAGAFGAHGLKSRLTPEMLTVFEVGVRYQMYHSFGLFVVSWACERFPSSSTTTTSGWLFIAGIIIFSGSLYLLSITGLKWLGAITPIGGLAFLFGWIMLAWSAVQK